jgi:hypothetical protein
VQQNNETASKLPVIVRSFGDEPVKLFLHRIENNRCYVGQPDSLRPIGLPFDQVFEFEVDTFTTLSTAFQQNDLRRLGELWANMTVDDFACNRYQDMSSSVHDQEHIANPESAPRSDAG